MQSASSVKVCVLPDPTECSGDACDCRTVTSPHLLWLDGIDDYGDPLFRMTCHHPTEGTPWQASDCSHPGECWLMSWWDALGREVLGKMRGPMVFPIPVKPDAMWSYDDGGSIVRAE